MSEVLDGNAVVWCEGAFNTPNGKTAHGLVRRTRRYRVLAVVDSAWAGRDAGDVLDGRPNGIPVVASLDEALRAAGEGAPPTHFVIGLAPDGGRLPAAGRDAVRRALEAGLHVDSGLHDFLSDDPEIAGLAAGRGLRLRDVRKPPSRSELHFFEGKIEQVTSARIAVLGTDSAVGKRTTAWILVDALAARGVAAELVGTGQTAWMQGARFSLILDSLVNDFLAGEIEHAVWSAWKAGAEVVVIEGQGSLMNPAYPGGYEILAAGRPDAVVMQHAPTRLEYDGFPGYALDPLERQIEAVEMISRRPVAAITLNHEGLDRAEVPEVCARIAGQVGRPVFDVLLDGADGLVDALSEWLPTAQRERS
jgi:uncharacterized NAD-dependent epimerase/dehydratase family protein